MDPTRKPAHVLVVDDDPVVLSSVTSLLRAAGREVTPVATAREARIAAAELHPDAVLLDVRLPDGDGLDVLDRLMALDPPPSVLVVTGEADVATAVAAMRRGAVDFIQKPIGHAALEEALERALANRVKVEGSRTRSEAAGIIGSSPALGRVLDQIARVASTPRTTVLVLGESGTGKELVARAIHTDSARREAPFVAVNCAALTDGLLESELFGYEPGAFTGASSRGREGLFEAARGGTIFLDEIGELAPGLQAKLLRVLQEGTYRRVGGCDDRTTDVRLVSSTNRDLEQCVADGAFRADLFYRLNVMSIAVPPLRDRRHDIPELATHFLALLGEEQGQRFDGFADAAMERLVRHTWPGNVRELRNAVERAALVAGSGVVRLEHLSLGGTGSSGSAETDHGPEDLSLQSLEASHIRRVIRRTGGNRSHAARLLGVNRTTLYSKLRRYGIEV
jgi:DNA-binding NtrC family response regulator